MQYRSQFEAANFVRIHDSGFVPVYDDGGAKPWVCFDGHQPDKWQAPVNVSFAGKPFDFGDVSPQRAGVNDGYRTPDPPALHRRRMGRHVQ